MRSLSPLILAATLTGCASDLPPRDPQQAWVELHAQLPSQTLSASRLDGQRLRDGRFFQMPPGAHELVMRYTFERSGGGSGGGMQPGSTPGDISCYLRVRYDGFTSGQRYRLEARPLAAKAQAWLYGEGRTPLARGEVLRCGPY